MPCANVWHAGPACHAQAFQTSRSVMLKHFRVVHRTVLSDNAGAGLLHTDVNDSVVNTSMLLVTVSLALRESLCVLLSMAQCCVQCCALQCCALHRV